MLKKSVFIIMLMILALILAGCGTKEKAAVDNAGAAGTVQLKKVTVMLDWMPNTNHTGLYAAMDKGFYKDQGLDVEILQPGQGTTTDQLVASGKADFGVSYQEGVTQARAAGVPLVSLAAVIQHNTSAFASLKKAGIGSAKEFEGKCYGGWGSPIEEAMLKAVMEKAGGNYARVKNVTLGATDFFKSIGRDADIEWIFYGWDGVEAARRGIDLNLLMLKDLDPALDYYTPVIITNEKNAAEQKELVKKFIAATAKGYQFAIANPGAAADILLKNAPELNPDLVKASQAWISPKYQDDAPRWGEQKEEVWRRYAAWMFARKLIPAMIQPEKAFTNEFLP